MSREYKPRVLAWRWARVLWMAIALAVAASTSRSAERFSIEEVTASLRQQRRKIESLHVRIRRVTTVFVDPKTLSTWPSPPALPEYQGTDEMLIAFKGDKRYSRLLELDYKSRPIAGSSAEPKSGTRRYLDEAKAWTGKVLLERKRDLRSGEYGYQSIPAENARDCFPPPPYLQNVGLAVADPTGKDDAQRNLQQFGHLPELFERWPYVVLEEGEEIDGAPCVMLEGKMKCALPVDNGSRTRSVSDKLWLDLDHGLALRKRETRFDGQLDRVVNSEFEEVVAGFWLPRRSQREVFAPPGPAEPYRERPVLTRELTLCFWLVNQQLPDELFDIALTPFTDEGSALDKVPAFHKRPFTSPHRDSRADEKWREEWAVRGVGRREETRQGSELVTLEVDTPRWHFVWTPKRNVVTAWPSRLDRASVATGKNRAQIVRLAELQQAMIACRREWLAGREVERLTAHYPQDISYISWPTALHHWNPRGQLSVTGTDFLTRTWWFDLKTDLCVGRRCGCIKPVPRAAPKVENPPPDFTIDYPPPETVPRELFKFEIPRNARLGINDPELGREIWSEGRPEADRKE